MPKACIYAGFRHLFYPMTLFMGRVIDTKAIIEKNGKEKVI